MIDENTEKILIKELNLELIAPSTKQLGETENFGGSKTVIIGKPGCFTKDTPILMYDGTIKNVQDVKEGDIVMGDDSTARNVIEICNNFDEMYKIIPYKGETYTVNKQHKLVLKSSTSEIVEITVENYLKETKNFKNNMKIFRNVVEFKKQDLDIDPYIVGLLFSNTVNADDKKFSNYLETYLLREEYDINLENIKNPEEKLLSNNEKKLINFMKDNNILFRTYIPRNYIINSIENRLKLLAGIFDIDGSIEKDRYIFNHKNETIFDDIVFILRSVGFLAKKRVIQEKSGMKYYKCIIYGGNINKIPFKNNKNKLNNSYKIEKYNQSGFIIESQGNGEYFGFTLDGNHRFLLGTCDVVRNTGKSTLIASLLYGKKHIFPVAVAFSGSEDSNGFYRRILPSTFVFNEYNENQIKSFIRRQKIAKQHLQNPWAVILLDDCTDDAKVFNTPLQQGMYKRGRHWSMWYIVSLQYAMDIKPVIRSNVDGVFILRDPILKNRKKIWENYASVVPDFNLFCSLMDNLTDDFCSMYISNQSRSNDWQDCVFWYKAASIPEDWKFGCPEYRQFHNDRFNQEYIDPFD